MHGGWTVSLQCFLDCLGHPKSDGVVGPGSWNRPAGYAHRAHESVISPDEIVDGAVGGVVGGQYEHLSPALLGDVGD